MNFLESILTMQVDIWTDGACSGNPGPGGWGVLLRCNGVEKELSGFEAETTNNRMELRAVIEALKALKKSCDVMIYTDSKYVMQGVLEWLENWKRNNWKTSNKKSQVKNVDLWQELDELLKSYNIKWQWVKGHSGNIENERVDTLAREAIRNI